LHCSSSTQDYRNSTTCNASLQLLAFIPHCRETIEMSTTNRIGIRYGFTMQAQQGSTGAHIFNATGTRSGPLPATFLESDCLAAIKLIRRLPICGTYRFVTQLSATPTNNANSFNSLGHSCSRQLTPLPSTRHNILDHILILSR
jgi:hypothetical protein